MSGEKTKSSISDKTERQSISVQPENSTVKDLPFNSDESNTIQESEKNRSLRISKAFTAIVISAGFSLVLTFLVSAAQVAGVISMGLAHLLVGLAWLFGVAAFGGWILSAPRKHAFKIWLGAALIIGIVSLSFDRWMTWKKAEQDRATQQSNTGAAVSPVVESQSTTPTSLSETSTPKPTSKKPKKTELQRRKERALKDLDFRDHE